MGAVSRKDRKAIAYPVDSVSHNSVDMFIKNNIKKYSILYADDCTAYGRHTALRVKHGKNEYVRGDIHTNSIESFWATIKRGYTGIYHQWSKKHLHRYINEFTYRHNHKGDNVVALLTTGAMGKRLSYKRLTSTILG